MMQRSSTFEASLDWRKAATSYFIFLTRLTWTISSEYLAIYDWISSEYLAMYDCKTPLRTSGI